MSGSRLLARCCWILPGILPQASQREAAREQVRVAIESASEHLSEGDPFSAVHLLAGALLVETEAWKGQNPQDPASHADLAHLFEAWGIALTHLGEFELASQAFGIAAEELRPLHDDFRPAFPLGNPSRSASQQALFLGVRRAAAIRAANDPEAAWKQLEAIRKVDGFARLDDYGAAFFRSQLGNALEDLGRFDEAIVEYENARAIWEKLGEIKQAAFERKTIGDSLRKLGKPQEALEQYRTARGLLEGQAISAIELQEFQTDEALALADLGQHRKALEGLDRALEALESWRKEIDDRGVSLPRSFSFSSVRRALGAWVRLQMKLEPEAAALRTLERIERFRARGLLRGAGLFSRASRWGSDLERRRSLLRRNLELFFELRTAPDREELRKSLSKLTHQIFAAKILLSRGPSVALPSAIPKPKPGHAALAYLLTSEGMFLWAGNSESWTLHLLAEGSELPKALEEIESAVRDLARRPRDGETPASLFSGWADRLLPPAARGLLRSSSFVEIVPDGAIHQCPFAAIPQEGSGRTLTMAVLPSLTFAATREPGSPEDGSEKISVIADPQFESEWLEPLQASEREARKIASFFPEDQTRLFLGAEASEARYRSEAAGPGRILHLSAHGVFSPTLEGGSAVVLSSGGSEDGWLWASEILAQPLGGKAVVLSSCRSASGEWVPGEGVIGLSHAFLQAGASGVVCALWSVDQQSTAALMRELYRGLAEGDTLSRSLAAAQESLRKDPRYAHPYYWAAFRVEGFGNWAPLALSSAAPRSAGTAEGAKTWYLAAAVVMLLLALFLRTRRRGHNT